MHCTSCGTLLPSGVRNCPNCGAPVVAPQPSTFQPSERTISFYDETIPFTDQDTPIPSPPSEPEPEVAEAKPEAEQLPPSSTLPVASPTFARRRPWLILTTALSILSLLVIAVLVFLLIQNTRPVSAPPNQFTTSDPQAIYSQVTTKLPAIRDAFNSKTSSTWKTITAGSCTVTGNSLHATAPQGGNILCESTTLTANNFACQVQIILTQGDIIGLIFRSSSAKTYTIQFTSQGIYQLASDQNSANSFKVLAQGINSAIKIGYGQPNLLTIIALGNMFYLYVNKHFIISTTDSSATSGLIGITGAGSITNAQVDATFSHLQLWKL